MNATVKSLIVTVVVGLLVAGGLTLLIGPVPLGDEHMPIRLPITVPQALGTLLGLMAGFFMRMLGNNETGGRITSDERKRALNFTPEAGRAVLYVYREGFYGKMQGVDIAVDAQRLAQLKSPRFTRLVLAPGHHTLAAQASALRGSDKGVGVLEIDIAPGAIAVVKLSLLMKLTHTNINLELLPDLAQAQRKIRGMTMVGLLAQPQAA